MREDALVAFAVGDLFLGVACRLRATLQGDTRVVLPQVLLASHTLDGSALVAPDWRDVQQHGGLPVALLGLVGLEQEHGRSPEHRLPGVVAMRLRDDAGVLCELGYGGVVVIIDVLAGVRQHEGWTEAAVHIDEAVERLLAQPDPVITGVPKLYIGNPELPRGRLGFLLPFRFDALERHARLTPELGRFAALTVGQADDRYRVAALGVQGDRPAGAPHEIRRVRTYHERRFACRRHIGISLSRSRIVRARARSKMGLA